MSGFLNVRKPAGLTSHQCVGAMRRVFDTRQVGHGGTLDPMATGVLTMAVGRATRFLQYLTTGKEYTGSIRLGRGQLHGLMRRWQIRRYRVGRGRLDANGFIGEIDQMPPRVSAIKKDGVRLYKLARAKKVKADFNVEPRRVLIESIDVTKFTEGDFPEMDVDVVCGGGTYIRSIARECGEALVVPLEHVDSTCNLRNPAGEFCVGGTLTKLERTRSGAFTIDDSLDLDEIRGKVEEGESPLYSIESVLQHLPFAELPLRTAQHWLNGGMVTVPAEDIEFACHQRKELTSGDPIRIYHPSSTAMLGIAQVDPQDQHKEFVLRKRLFI
ncbi:tRNA pseudouridine synthase B [Phytophthora citrophthora]|uniref:tRNA pseudouridine(55) synthase n=1 Tax=Phytophthora citrophthora TaxID=4793 RepID=A0AAD9H0G6_9STRA|nr:tRNA pseudouridine synthase B [Phytophthora citrophthora]